MTRELIDIKTTYWYRCSKCDKSYFVDSTDKESHLLKKSLRCPNYVRCSGKITKRSWSNVEEIRNYEWVPALELYQASFGLGLKAERNCSPDTLSKILLGHRAVAADIQKTGDPNKSILLSITLENGKMIHLASSTKGAIVYKITGG